MLGVADRARVVDLFDKVMSGDIAAALNELDSQYAEGAAPEMVLTDLAGFVHLVTRMRIVPASAEDASLSEAERRAFERAAITPDPVPRDRVNAITLMIAPDRFARLAWAHYSARPDSCAFVAEIMRGTAPFDVLPP